MINFFDRLPVRDRLAERRCGLRQTAQRPKRIVFFDGRRLLHGTATMHRTKQARLFRCRLRLKILTQGVDRASEA